MERLIRKLIASFLRWTIPIKVVEKWARQHPEGWIKIGNKWYLTHNVYDDLFIMYPYDEESGGF